MGLQVCVYVIHLLCYQTWLFIVMYQLSKNSPHCTTYRAVVMAKWIWPRNAGKLKPSSCKKLRVRMKLQADRRSGKQTLVVAKPNQPWAASHIFSLQTCVCRATEWSKWGKQLGSTKMSPPVNQIIGLCYLGWFSLGRLGKCWLLPEQGYTCFQWRGAGVCGQRRTVP